ncbi:MAG: hypothetical protein EOP38_21135 [Rubrivivax sp.]|nr:MAG: hypothetical protein EOP38_21135 [Rubrivivax sp.]
MPSNVSTNKKAFWMKIPGLATLLEIGSDYVSEGSADYFGKIAPLRCWIAALWKALTGSAMATIAAVYIPKFFCTTAVAPGELALTIVPSLLGFGIGVYALIFGLSANIIRGLQEGHLKAAAADTSGKTNTSVLSLNSAFAFPLSMMAVTIFLSVLHQALPMVSTLANLTWFLVFFCIILTFQLVRTLFRLGQVIILRKFEHDDA